MNELRKTKAKMTINGIKSIATMVTYIVTVINWLLVLYFPKWKFGNELLKGSQKAMIEK